MSKLEYIYTKPCNLIFDFDERHHINENKSAYVLRYRSTFKQFNFENKQVQGRNIHQKKSKALLQKQNKHNDRRKINSENTYYMLIQMKS